jgi:hypothetical protein
VLLPALCRQFVQGFRKEIGQSAPVVIAQCPQVIPEAGAFETALQKSLAAILEEVLLSHAQKRALIGNNVLFVPAAIRFHKKCTTSKGRPERSEREKQGKYNRP